MTGNDAFTCAICGEPSTTICVYCTLDACENHLCERCCRCSDCCACDIRTRVEQNQPHLPMKASPNGSDLHFRE